ncbi:MAG: DUF4235 domain-containing protein [Beutenbergiaceae bacterium]
MNPQKLITTVLSIGTGFLATKALSVAWKGITGHEPPEAIDDDGEISITEVVIFAGVSAAVAALLQSYVRRGTAKWLASGDIPK